jgi:hypothetical protein
MATPVYSDGPGDRTVIAVIHEGTRYDRPVPGLVEYRLPRGSLEVSIPCPDRPDHPPLVLTLDRSVWPTIMVQSDDARVAPAWASLVQAGVITEELLADVPELQEEVLARNKAAKLVALDAWFETAKSAGYLVPDTNPPQRLLTTDNDLLIYNGALSIVERGIKIGELPEGYPATVVCADGSLLSRPVSQMELILFRAGAYRAGLSPRYAAYKAAIETATNTEQLDAITFE